MGEDPNSDTQLDCIGLRQNWSPAVFSDEIVEHVVAKHGWGTRGVVFANGKAYATANHRIPGCHIGDAKLCSVEDGFLPTFASLRVLVSSVDQEAATKKG